MTFSLSALDLQLYIYGKFSARLKNGCTLSTAAFTVMQCAIKMCLAQFGCNSGYNPEIFTHFTVFLQSKYMQKRHNA